MCDAVLNKNQETINSLYRSIYLAVDMDVRFSLNEKTGENDNIAFDIEDRISEVLRLVDRIHNSNKEHIIMVERELKDV